MTLGHYQYDQEALERLSADERRQAELDLAALEALRVHDPLQFFRPHTKQHQLMAVNAAVRAFLGGNRSGKTTVGIVDDIVQAVDWEAVPEHLRQYKRWTPPFYCRILTPDFTATMEGVVYQKLREWCPRDQLVGGVWDKAYDKQNRILRFKNGSWFQFMTYEQDLDKFGGAALHRIHYDEEPPEAIRKECLMRLIDYGGEELFTMTPLMGMTWMFAAIWEAWLKGTLEDSHVVTVDMDENPYLDEKTKRRVLAGLTEEERRARKEGRFVHFGGLIFSEFSRELHVIPQADEPNLESHEPSPFVNDLVYVGIDPGLRHQAAVVFCAVDYEDHMTVFDEIAVRGATVADVCAEIHKRNARWAISPTFYLIDPASRNKNHQTGRSDQMEYADHGIMAVPAQNAVRPGINRVKERLQFKKLSITANCGTLVDQFRMYRWASPSHRSDEDPAEKPIKKDDHLLDALRYVCMARPIVPRLEVPEQILPLHERLALDAMRMTKGGNPSLAQGGPGMFA